MKIYTQYTGTVCPLKLPKNKDYSLHGPMWILYKQSTALYSEDFLQEQTNSFQKTPPQWTCQSCLSISFKGKVLLAFKQSFDIWGHFFVCLFLKC